MGNGQSKRRLKAVLIDPEFIDPEIMDSGGGKRDARKIFRAVRKRQMRESELRMRRAHALQKRLGIK